MSEYNRPELGDLTNGENFVTLENGDRHYPGGAVQARIKATALALIQSLEAAGRARQVELEAAWSAEEDAHRARFDAFKATVPGAELTYKGEPKPRPKSPVLIWDSGALPFAARVTQEFTRHAMPFDWGTVTIQKNYDARGSLSETIIDAIPDCAGRDVVIITGGNNTGRLEDRIARSATGAASIAHFNLVERPRTADTPGENYYTCFSIRHDEHAGAFGPGTDLYESGLTVHQGSLPLGELAVTAA